MQRKEKLYENCEVFSIENKLIFRCSRRKINWYLKKGLAEKINETPLSIRLNFKTNGKGEPEQVLKIKRENKCVVCGENEMSKLTKHHIVPYEFRKYFPQHYKSNLSILVVGLCEMCHSIYENKHAILLKNMLFDQAGIKDMQNKKSIIKLLVSLEKNIKTFKKCDGILKKIEIALEKNHNLMKLDILKIKTLDNVYIKNIIEQHRLSQMTRGYMVCKNIKDFIDFSIMWFNHFVEKMQPTNMVSNLTSEAIIDSLMERKKERLKTKIIY